MQGYFQKQHLLKNVGQGDEGSRIGQREEFTCETITMKASKDPWVTLKLE